MTDLIKVEDHGPMRVVRMNRPDKKNALTTAMYDAMAAALEEADQRPQTRVVMIAGAPGAFTAGNDIADFVAVTEQGGGLPAATIRFIMALATGRRPLVAAVDGLAIGIGTTMLFHCDQVVASARSVFRTPFVSLGLVPEAGSSLLAPRAMGRQAAYRLLCLGERFDADAAFAAGFVSHVVADAELEADARKTADAIAAMPAGAMAASRALLRADAASVVAAIQAEVAAFNERLASPEAKEAFRSFLSRG